MNIVLLQTALLEHEITLLIQEFPQFLFLSLSDASYKTLAEDYWNRVEILYGSKLTVEEFNKAHHLRWIHCPFPSLTRLCMEDIAKQGLVLVSNTLEENTFQVGEFVMSAMLAFAKNLYHWKEIYSSPAQVWNSKWRDSMLTLKNKVFLQVGLNTIGTEIARRAKQQEMQVWGVQEKRSFHPHCHKVFELKQIRDLLPEIDVLCLSLSKRKEYHHLLQLEELDLIKPDSILIILGSIDVIQEDALSEVARTGKFRGILIDASYQNPIPLTSKLWDISNMIITPEVAPRPKSSERQAFRLFLYNLRQYLHGNYKDMKNLLTLDR